jgi:DNA topoisomerase IB
VLGAVIRLLELTLIRVGNDEYAKLNRSFGLTTLRDRHATISGSAVTFRFRGKAGIVHEVGLRDRRLAAVVRRCQELPGQELFQYVDDDGVVRDVASDDVNDYLRRDLWRRLHGQGLPDLGRHAAGRTVPSARSSRRTMGRRRRRTWSRR